MKTTRAIAISALVLFGALTAASAEARPWHGGGWGWGPRLGIGVDVGLGLGLAATSPYYYPYSYYPYYATPVYTAPVVVTQPAPQVYIQQGAPAPAPVQQAQPATNDWFYCRNPAGYYPYVRSCANGWERVPSQPQTQN
jgi:hypothetical protein